MTAPAVSPIVPSYANLQPYLTVAEFLAAPTGVDTSQLIPGGGTAANNAALTTVIASASNYADSLCYQILAATSDLQVGEYRVQRDGTIRVPLDNSPVVEVTAVKMGTVSSSLQALTDLSGVWFQGRKVIRIPVPSLQQASASGAVASSGSVFAQVSYVNGYANTSLAGLVIVGATSVTVSSALGIFPGLPLTIYDDAAAKTEAAVVAQSYVQGSTTVPLVSPLTQAHTAGTAVSALPRAVKQAVTALTAHLIKTRGAESIAFSGVSGGPSAVEKDDPGSSEEYEEAVDLLHPFRRVA